MASLAGPSGRSLLLRARYKGQELGIGTGFVMDGQTGPLLMTNWHVVSGRRADTGQPISKTGGIPDELEILHHHKGHFGEWVPRIEPLRNASSAPLWREHPLHGSRVDAVALPLTQLDDVKLLKYLLTDGPIAYGPSDPVNIIGFPFGLTAGGALPVWVTGFIASEPSVGFEGLPLMLVDSRTRPGQSGSPVIAYRSGGFVQMEDGSSRMFNAPAWRFLGIYSGRINDQSDLGLVWNLSAVTDILQKGVPGTDQSAGPAVPP